VYDLYKLYARQDGDFLENKEEFPHAESNIVFFQGLWVHIEDQIRSQNLFICV